MDTRDHHHGRGAGDPHAERSQSGAPPTDRTPAPTGVAATLPALGLIILAVVIVGLVLFGGWVAFGFAAALGIAGVLVFTRQVQRIAWTRSSRRQLRRGLSGMNEDLSITDEAHTELSPHDIPLDSPVRRKVARGKQR